MSYTVTLRQLRCHHACYDGYNKLASSLLGLAYKPGRKTYIGSHHKEAIPLATILESNSLDDALWALRCVKGHDKEIRLFAVWCARQVEHLTDDARVKHCNDTTERFANGEATSDELAAAKAEADAARDAAARAAWAAADTIAEAIADAAADAARAAARAAADAARVDARAAADAAMAATWAATKTNVTVGAAARAAADAARDKQTQKFIALVS